MSVGISAARRAVGKSGSGQARWWQPWNVIHHVIPWSGQRLRGRNVEGTCAISATEDNGGISRRCWRGLDCIGRSCLMEGGEKFCGRSLPMIVVL